MPAPTPTPIAPSRLPDFLASTAWPLAPAQLAETMSATPWLDGYDHYDRVRCLLNARGMMPAGGPALPWADAIDAAFDRYGRQLVLKNHGISPWHAYAGGAARLYMESKDADALSVVRTLIPSETREKLDEWYRSVGLSREVAFMLQDAVAAERCGLGPVAVLDLLAEVAAGHLRQWAAPPASRAWATFTKPFMVSLTCLALIEYLEHRDAAGSTDIPVLIGAALDSIWDACWLPTHADWPHGCFAYMDLDGAKAPQPIGPIAVRSVADRRHFAGPDSLPSLDGHFVQTLVRFTSGDAKGKEYRVVGYDGASRAFTLPPTADYAAPPSPGDPFVLDPIYDRDGGPTPAPDLNHLISPAYAWMYARTGLPVWRERHDAIFDGGVMSWGPPTAQKQWNQAWYAGPEGLAWRAAGAGAEDRAARPPQPVPPAPRSFEVAMPAPGVVRVDVTFPERQGDEAGAFDTAVKAFARPPARSPDPPAEDPSVPLESPNAKMSAFDALSPSLRMPPAPGGAAGSPAARRQLAGTYAGLAADAAPLPRPRSFEVVMPAPGIVRVNVTFPPRADDPSAFDVVVKAFAKPPRT